MRHHELIVQHRYRNKLLGVYRLVPHFKTEMKPVTLGASRDANVRLLGENVSGIHAMFDYSNGHWHVTDLGSKSGTWLGKEAVTSAAIEGAQLLRIGSHTLSLEEKVWKTELFQNQKPLQEGTLSHQQVVLSKNGQVISTHVIALDKSFEVTMDDGSARKIEPAEDFVWQQYELDRYEVKVRQIKVNEVSKASLSKTIFDHELKVPMVIVLLLFSLLMGITWLTPNQPTDELISLKPEQNQYTKMIYDKKTAIEKRKRALLESEKIKASKPPSQKTVAGRSKALQGMARQGKDVQIADRIRAVGLGRLIGKISKRASKTASLVSAVGVLPDSDLSGKSLSRPGQIGHLSKGKKSKSFQLKGVKTAGRGGGGSSNFKGLGALAQSHVGVADVGILEEETVVKGGLSREIIAEVIRSHLGQIRYCYERQLSATPDLYGKVLIQFTITADGRVSGQGIQNSTMKNAMVEGCMLRRLAGWKFPSPEGGTSVRVTYPFLFKSTN